jgi:hypothetical protein
MQLPIPLSNLPTWAQVVSMVGFPIIVAVFFLLKEIGYLPSPAEAQMQSLDNLTRQHATTNAQLDELVRLSRLICRNTAKDRWTEQKCYPE